MRLIQFKHYMAVIYLCFEMSFIIIPFLQYAEFAGERTALWVEMWRPLTSTPGWWDFRNKANCTAVHHLFHIIL